MYLFYLFFALIAERRVVRLWYNPILIVVRNLADEHPRMRGFGSARLRKKNQDKKSMVERLWLFILCFASINCKCFNQLLKGEIYANMNKLSSNLTAFRINLFINLKDSWPSNLTSLLMVVEVLQPNELILATRIIRLILATIVVIWMELNNNTGGLYHLYIRKFSEGDDSVMFIHQ